MQRNGKFSRYFEKRGKIYIVDDSLSYNQKIFNIACEISPLNNDWHQLTEC